MSHHRGEEEEETSSESEVSTESSRSSSRASSRSSASSASASSASSRSSASSASSASSSSAASHSSGEEDENVSASDSEEAERVVAPAAPAAHLGEPVVLRVEPEPAIVADVAPHMAAPHAAERVSHVGDSASSESSSEGSSSSDSESEVEGAAAAPVAVPANFVDERKPLISELLKEERLYNRRLDQAREVFINPLKGAKKPVSDRHVKSVLNGLDDMADGHRDFSRALLQKHDSWGPTSTIGDLFLVNLKLFKQYGQAGSRFETSLQSISKLKKHTPDFNNYLEYASKDNRLEEKELLFYLLQPYNQLLKYIQLLEHINLKTPSDHPDKKNIEKAIATLSEISKGIESNSGQQISHVREMLQVNSEFTDRSESFVDPSRHVVKVGDCQEVLPRSIEDRRIVLFNDLLVLGVRKADGSYKLMKTLDLSTSRAINPGDNESGRHLLSVDDGMTQTVLTFPRSSARGEWLKLIQMSIDGIANLRYSGFTLKLRQEKHVVLDPGLKDDKILNELLKPYRKVHVINVGGKGYKKWPKDRVQYYTTELVNSEEIGNITRGATCIYLVLVKPFDKYPELLLKSLEHCFQPTLFTTSYASVLHGKKDTEVLVLDRKR